MPRSHVLCSGVFAAALVCASAQPAKARIYNATVTGHASDTSNPLDGLGDAAGPTGDLIDLVFNNSDSNPLAIMDRRGVFEIDVSTMSEHNTGRAFVEFDVEGGVSPYPVNVYLYAGDGLLTADDYGRTDALVYSAVLADNSPLIDVSSQVEGIVEGGDTWIGVLIALTHEDQTLTIDNTDGGGIDPRLNTKAVPEPATLTLLAALSLAAFARRRRPA